MIHQGDCLEVLKRLDDNSMDSLVTDPPAGISFMNKSWDDDKGGRDEWISWLSSVMKECLRVMKPGAHGLVWAIPRTSHWTGMALESAGFEVRDVVTHLFGSGFPKSLDVSKAIDKMYGAEREIVSSKLEHNIKGQRIMTSAGNRETNLVHVTKASTDDAKQWQGWGTALKPASEHWILVRKPLSEKTVAKNVLKWGTGGINIDASRIEGKIESGWSKSGSKAGPNLSMSGGNTERLPKPDNPIGRFPANLVFSHTEHCTEEQCDIECAIKMLDEQSGTLKSGAPGIKRAGNNGPALGKESRPPGTQMSGFGDAGGASRFFYCAKVSSSERNAGLEGMPLKKNDFQRETSGLASTVIDGVRQKGNCGQPNQNHHPTVKPQKLMRYLIRLITPPKGTVLDCFMGSGSTGLAAKTEGFEFVGIEREPEYFEIAKRRIDDRTQDCITT